MRPRFARTALAIGALLAIAPARAAASEHLALGAGVTSVQRASAAQIDRPLLGPTVALTFVEHHHDKWRLLPGFDLQVGSTFAADGLWMADVSIAWIATLALTEGAINPFVSFGPDAAFVTADGVDSSWAVGVRADVGLHGVLFDALYWRAKVGVVAVGVAGLRTEVLVGHAFM